MVLGEMDGPAALFSNVVGFPGQVTVGNVLAHRRRLAKAIGAQESNLTESYLRQKREFVEPVLIDHAPTKAHVFKGNEVNLFKILPALTHHEEDSGPYLTCGIAFCRDPDNGLSEYGRFTG